MHVVRLPLASRKSRARRDWHAQIHEPSPLGCTLARKPHRQTSEVGASRGSIAYGSNCLARDTSCGDWGSAIQTRMDLRVRPGRHIIVVALAGEAEPRSHMSKVPHYDVLPTWCQFQIGWRRKSRSLQNYHTLACFLTLFVHLGQWRA